MKKFLISLFLILSLPIVADNGNDIVLKSSVSEATVFISGAQITRKKSVDLPTGKSVLKFSDLSPYIDGKSVQVKLNSGVMVLSVNYQLNFTDSLKQTAELDKLENQLNTINDKLKVENTNLEIINDELAFLNENKNIGGTTQGVNITSLKEAANYYHERVTLLKFKEIEVKKSIDKLNSEKSDIEHQAHLSGNVKITPVGEVIMNVETKSSVKCDIELTYYVKNAGWYPSYDIRANTIEDPIELIYKANIHQNTKEEWKNVKLTVSSANPNVGNVAPQLKTYLLNYYTKPPRYDNSSDVNQLTGKVFDQNSKEPIVGAVVMIKGTTIGTVSDVNGNYSISVPNNGKQLEVSYIGYEKQIVPITNSVLNVFMKEEVSKLNEVVVVGYGSGNKELSGALEGRMSGLSAGSGSEVRIRGASSIPAGTKLKDEFTPLPINQIENQTNVEFEIKTPYTINSDNKNLSVEVDRYSLPAEYEYFCVPKVDKDAFLLANIVDWEKYNLLEGEANIFFENTFVGKTILDVRFVSDTLSLSLGRDKNVIVNREKIKDNTKKQFFGNKKEDSREWKLTVKNNKKQFVNFVLLDQIPVSTMDEIEVVPENLSGAELNKENGEVKWKFKLKPGAKKEMDLIYKVKYPKDKSLQVE